MKKPVKLKFKPVLGDPRRLSMEEQFRRALHASCYVAMIESSRQITFKLRKRVSRGTSPTSQRISQK